MIIFLIFIILQDRRRLLDIFAILNMTWSQQENKKWVNGYGPEHISSGEIISSMRNSLPPELIRIIINFYLWSLIVSDQFNNEVIISLRVNIVCIQRVINLNCLPLLGANDNIISRHEQRCRRRYIDTIRRMMNDVNY